MDGSRGLLPLGIAKVSGASMVPTLYDGDVVLVRYGTRIHPGDLVLAVDPRRRGGAAEADGPSGPGLILVKRATRRQDGGWWLLADNPFAPGDSRQFGAVPDRLVLGRVVVRLRPVFRPGTADERPAGLGAVRRGLRGLRAALHSLRRRR